MYCIKPTVIVCEQPTVVPNSVVDIGSITYQSIVTYACAQGYIIDDRHGGNTTLQCMADGHWNGTTIVCSSKIFDNFSCVWFLNVCLC